MHIKASLLATTVAALLGGGVALADTQCELNFGFDSSALPASADADLAGVVSLSAMHPELLIVLDGNTDATGSEAYNIGLSIRRAEAVRDDLVMLGMDKDRIVIAAYGKDGEKRTTQSGERRVTVWSTRESMAAVIDHTFAGKGTSVNWDRPMTMAQTETWDEVAGR